METKCVDMDHSRMFFKYLCSWSRYETSLCKAKRNLRCVQDCAIPLAATIKLGPIIFASLPFTRSTRNAYADRVSFVRTHAIAALNASPFLPIERAPFYVILRNSSVHTAVAYSLTKNRL